MAERLENALAACEEYFGVYAKEMIVDNTKAHISLRVEAGKFPQINLNHATGIQSCVIQHAYTGKNFKRGPYAAPIQKPAKLVIAFTGARADYEEEIHSKAELTRVLNTFFSKSDVASICAKADECRAAETEMTHRFNSMVQQVISALKTVPGYDSVPEDRRRQILLDAASKVSVDSPTIWEAAVEPDIWGAMAKISTLLERLSGADTAI